VRRVGAVIIVLVALGVGAAAGLAAANLTSPQATPGPVAAANASPAPTASPAATARPTPVPTPTPAPTPVLVPAPLDGVPVDPALAVRRPIAVMIDDLRPARPQSGFSSASVVWHAPAEGGIPRYMMIFQEKTPTLVGPVRSSRYYYIAWASEWRSVYVHAGGSPQALATLRSKGHGQYVYNVDDFRYEGVYLWRLRTRAAPHNVYTDGANLRKLAKVVGSKDPALPPAPVWTFAPDAAFGDRPTGGTIDVGYLANKIHYAYDRATNTYLRGVTGESKQVDAATGKRVAPKNVVIMLVRFGPLNDGHPNKKRLEADLVGKGTAWIATNGRTIKGTWRKDAITKPTRFFDAAGNPVTLTVGQTFVQVLQTGSKVTIKDGKLPFTPAPPRQRPL
jgi:Protein of unknown function (DUF3048) N-terminal domain/Protein of unknown function (DUF3048) C-terminal domain